MTAPKVDDAKKAASPITDMDGKFNPDTRRDKKKEDTHHAD